MRAKVKLNLTGAGHGSVSVDDFDMSHMVTGVEVAGHVGEATKVSLYLTAAALQDITMEAGELKIKGQTIPSAVELALYRFLQAKFDPVPRAVDVTSCDSMARQLSPDR